MENNEFEISKLTTFKLDIQQAIAHRMKNFSTAFKGNLALEGNGKAKIDLFRTMENLKITIVDNDINFDISLKDDFINSFSDEEIENLKNADKVALIRHTLNRQGIGFILADSDEYEQPDFAKKIKSSIIEKLAANSAIAINLVKNFSSQSKGISIEKYFGNECLMKEINFNEKQLLVFSNIMDLADRTEILIDEDGENIKMRFLFEK